MLNKHISIHIMSVQSSPQDYVMECGKTNSLICHFKPYYANKIWQILYNILHSLESCHPMQNAIYPIYSNFGLIAKPFHSKRLLVETSSKTFAIHAKLWKFGTTSHVVFLVQIKKKTSHNLDKPLNLFYVTSNFLEVFWDGPSLFVHHTKSFHEIL